MDFLNGNTIVLSKKYQLVALSLFDNSELIGSLYYFKRRGSFLGKIRIAVYFHSILKQNLIIFKTLIFK